MKLNERGGYLSQHVENYRLGGVVSFRSAYTQVGGNPDPKPGHGWNTLTTSVIEGLNVLDIVTADRIVCQISTDHPPLIDYVPTVTFLGTRFENLRIAGHQVKLDLDLDILGAKPKKDAGYLSDRDFQKRASAQRERLKVAHDQVESVRPTVAQGFTSMTEFRRRQDSELSLQQASTDLYRQISTKAVDVREKRHAMAEFEAKTADNLAVLRAALADADAAVAEARSKQGYVVSAPVAGHVTSLQASVGMTAPAATTIQPIPTTPNAMYFVTLVHFSGLQQWVAMRNALNSTPPNREIVRSRSIHLPPSLRSREIFSRR